MCHAQRCCCFLIYLSVRREEKTGRGGWRGKSPLNGSSERAPVISQSPAKQIFCPSACSKSKPCTQQAPLPAVLPTKQESVKPPVPTALLKALITPALSHPTPPLQLLYSGVSNISLHRGFGLAPAFSLG